MNPQKYFLDKQFWLCFSLCPPDEIRPAIKSNDSTKSQRCEIAIILFPTVKLRSFSSPIRLVEHIIPDLGQSKGCSPSVDATAALQIVVCSLLGLDVENTKG